MTDLRRLTLRRDSGLVTPGVFITNAKEAIRSGDSFFRGAIGWETLAGEGLLPDANDLHEAARRWFGYEDLLGRISRTIARFGFSYSSTVTAQRELLELALADDWPARIEEASELVAEAKRTTTPASTATERGLLWLMSNALEDPWDSAREPLPPQLASRRFARLAMVATGMATIPAHLQPSVILPNPGTGYPTAAALLGDGRLAERDSMIRWVVRATELYDELLPAVLPGVHGAFLAARGMTIRTWIVKALSLANLVEQEISNKPHLSCELDLRSASPDQLANPIVSVIDAMATTRDAFPTLFRDARGRATDQTLAVEPIRQRPILKLAERRYLLLVKDFLAAAADDGVWYVLHETLGSRFGAQFGVAMEQYAERVLRRCAAGSNHGLVRVPESTKSGVLRCDFLWRFGDDLFLIDAKRTGLSSAHLMGADVSERIDQQIGYAVRQILSTQSAIEKGELDDLIEKLGVPRGWRPRYKVPLIITHRPIFMFFSSAARLLERLGDTAQLDASFAWPTVWSLADLELLEAAVPEIDLGEFVNAAVSRRPITTCGVGPYLDEVRYKGMVASKYFDDRRHEILAEFTQQG